MTTATSDKARQVKLLILDVDGVLTDGGLCFDNRGEEYKTFNSLDGHGIRMLLECGIQVGVITGRKSAIVEHRMKDLGVEQLYQGNRDKLPALEKMLEALAIDATAAAYVGDDLPDLPIMQRVGFAIAVQNAHGFVKQHCDWVTNASGGHGAVREVCDFILQAQGLLEQRSLSYLE